jgi:type IV pilus assembly protein PilO
MQSRREQLFTAVSAVLVLAGFGRLVAWPQHEHLNAARASAGQLERQVEARESMGELGIAYQQRLRELSQEAASLAAQVPETSEMGTFLEQLSEIAANLGLKDEDLTPQPPQVVGNLKVFPLELRFVSTFPALYAFLEQVEQMDRTVYVSSIHSYCEEELASRLTTELTLHIYCEAPH